MIALLCRLFVTASFIYRNSSQLRHPERLIENTSICLILPDFDYKKVNRHDPDVDKHARRWADILREKHGLTGKKITKVIHFSPFFNHQKFRSTRLSN